MNRKEGRARTQSFECPHEMPLETRGQIAQISNIDMASEKNTGESISDNNSDLFETISECSVDSFNKKFANTLCLQTPLANWQSMAPRAMTNEDYLNF